MPEQTASAPQQPATLIDYLITKSSGFGFGDPNKNQTMAYMDDNTQLKALPTFDLTAGKFGTSEEQFSSAERLGDQIIAMAQKDNVDLSKFPEVKAAMGYDQDVSKLTGAELGAFMMGYAASQDVSQKLTLGQKIESALNQIGGSASVVADEQNASGESRYQVKQDIKQDVRETNSVNAGIQNKAPEAAKVDKDTIFNADESPELTAFAAAIGQQIYGSHSPATASVSGMQVSQQVINPPKPQ